MEGGSGHQRTRPSSGSAEERRWRAGGLQAAVVAAVLSFFVGFGFTFGRPTHLSPRTSQPVQFNHGVHDEEQELTCLSCHEFVQSDQMADLPEAEICENCHLTAQGESAEADRLTLILQEGRPLDWQPLFRQPPHVYFSHRRHVGAAALECSECHGGFGESERPPRRVRRLEMQSCVDCHKTSGVSEDCSSCHR